MAKFHGAAVALERWPARECPLSAYLAPGDGVLDLGANVGEYTRGFAALVGPTGYVLAVEADPRNAIICGSLAEDTPQVRVVAAAVADRCGIAALSIDAENSRRNSLWRANLTHDSALVITVPTLTVDAIAPDVPHLKAIKVDVQGAEGLMFRGATRTLERTDLVWWVELWPVGLARAGTRMSALVADLQVQGWRPEGTTWLDVLARAEQHPQGVQNVLLRHRATTPQKRD